MEAPAVDTTRRGSFRMTARREAWSSTASAGRFATSATLTAIVLGSTALRFAFGLATPAPFIFPDELVYFDLGRSIASSHAFTLGGTPFSPWSYGPLYPILISPVFALGHSAATAYSLVKLLNAVLVSTAAIPAYLLARRIVAKGSALAFAAIAMVVPALVYSNHVMTESVAYPIFLTAILSIQRVLERPTKRRQMAALVVMVAAVLTRAEFAVLLPALLTAIALARPPGYGARRLLSRFMATFVIVGFGTAVGVVVGVASGSALAGRPHVGQLHLAHAPEWFLYHVAELDLASGVAPFIAFLLLAKDLRTLSPRLREFVATTLATSAWLLLFVGTYATIPRQRPPILERYVFYLIPLFVLALLAWRAESRLRMGAWTRSRVAVVSIAAVLPLALPFDRVLTSRMWGVNTATVGLVPWGLLRLAFDESLVPTYIATGALCFFALLLLLGRGRANRPTSAVATYFIAMTLITQAANYGLAAKARRQGLGATGSAWVDEKIGTGASVVAIWSGNAAGGWHSGIPLWESRFFNESVTRIYALCGPLPGLEVLQGPVSSWRVTMRNDQVFADGRPVEANYVLADPHTAIVGRPIAADPRSGLSLYRLSGELRLKGGDAHAGRCLASAPADRA